MATSTKHCGSVRIAVVRQLKVTLRRQNGYTTSSQGKQKVGCHECNSSQLCAYKGVRPAPMLFVFIMFPLLTIP